MIIYVSNVKVALIEPSKIKINVADHGVLEHISSIQGCVNCVDSILIVVTNKVIVIRCDNQIIYFKSFDSKNCEICTIFIAEF